ncbi:MAG: Calx-beta domain-containing protein, partial [Arenimonas sp.]
MLNVKMSRGSAMAMIARALKRTTRIGFSSCLFMLTSLFTLNAYAAGGTWTINNVSVAEGNIGTTNLVFDVSFARTANGTVQVNFATADGTATLANNDYTNTTGIVQFAGNTSGTKTVTIPIIADTNDEPNETFTVTISAPTGGSTITTAVGTGTINNDDLPVDLSITKTDGVASVAAGGSATYTITASNAGPGNASNATVVDNFPASLTGVTWTCAGAGGGICPASGSSNINSAVNLPNGASVTFTASATVSSAASGSISNTATITNSGSDTNPGNNSATDTDTVTQQADVTITKTDGVASVIAGSSVTYTITASNAGPSDTTATVADTFPASLSSISWTCVGAG